MGAYSWVLRFACAGFCAVGCFGAYPALNGRLGTPHSAEFDDCYAKVKSPALLCAVGTVSAPDEDIARTFARANAKLLLLDAFRSQMAASVDQSCSTSKTTGAGELKGRADGQAQASLGGLRTPPLKGTAEARILGAKIEATQRCTASEGFSQTTSLEMIGLQTAGWHWDGGKGYVIMTVPFEAIRMAVNGSSVGDEQKKAMLRVVEVLEESRKTAAP